MGLAASQARFLLLSSRQSDVELRMQSITNQKLALQRRSGDIAAKYQRSLNATNLYWNGGQVNYSAITNPTSNYLVTNSYGAVVLNDTLASLLNEPALPASGSGTDFEALYPDEEKFLKAISVSEISEEDAKTVIKDYKEAIKAQDELDKKGVGTGPVAFGYVDKDILTSGVINNMSLLEYYNDNTTFDLLGSDDASRIHVSETIGGKGMSSDSGSVQVKPEDLVNYRQQLSAAAGACTEIINGFSDALASAYYKELCQDGGPLAKNSALVTAACEYARQATLNQYLYGEYDTDPNTTETNDDMLKKYSNGEVVGGLRLFEINEDVMMGDEDHSNRSEQDEQKNLNTIDFISEVSSASTSMGDQATLDADVKLKVYSKEIIETYMNYFDMYMDAHDGDESYTTGTPNKTPKTKTVITEKFTQADVDAEEASYRAAISGDDKYHHKTVFDGTNYVQVSISPDESNAMVTADVGDHIAIWKTEHTKVVQAPDGYTSKREGVGGNIDPELYAATTSSTASAQAQYYIKLYNALCKSGWVTDSKVGDSKYLENQLMYGNYVVGQMDSFTEHSELSVTDSAQFTIEEDKKAAEKAKVEYEAERDNLAYKETLLDAQLDSLTTEREEIQTEKDSVQALIDENVKKFKLFA
ncbi:MAG: hypothetical protein MJ229_01310 [bacterium]|nr:hypothetical protein [bacterium]